MSGILGPKEFAEKMKTDVFTSLGKQYTVQNANVTGEQISKTIPAPTASVMFVAKEPDKAYVIPLVQAYIEYLDIFDGDFPRYLEDICKRVEEYNHFIHDDAEIEYDS